MKVSKSMLDIQYLLKVINSTQELVVEDKSKHTKAKKAIDSMLRRLDIDVLTEYNSDADDLRLKHCATDATTKIILRSKDGAYEFTQDGMAKLKVDLKPLNEKVREFDLRIEQIRRVDFAGLPSDVIEYFEEFGLFAADKDANLKA
jgi:hypothetical protein